MAGSYNHCTSEDGGFIGEEFTSMIENLGDAYEACEEMHYMIRYLADGDPVKIIQAKEAFYKGEEIMVHGPGDNPGAGG